MKLLRSFGFTTLVAAVALASPALAQQQVPEIDPSLTRAGLSVLVGGLIVLMARRRK